MASSKVNVDALYAALDLKRERRQISWRELAKEAHVSPSTLSRIRNGDARPSVEAYASLTEWLGMSPDSFINSDATAEAPDLSAQLAPLLRARKDLSPSEIRYLEDVFNAAVNFVMAEHDSE
ncbi:MAG TPA: helix-turn-helix transcriptional regulator [Acidimicrobiales bacterium]|nr:helix-turn-helix transcriptional regulator [Acidimicrobiales bacterium]